MKQGNGLEHTQLLEALEIYTRAVEENWDIEKCKENHMEYGVCSFMGCKFAYAFSRELSHTLFAQCRTDNMGYAYYSTPPMYLSDAGKPIKIALENRIILINKMLEKFPKTM